MNSKLRKSVNSNGKLRKQQSGKKQGVANSRARPSRATNKRSDNSIFYFGHPVNSLSLFGSAAANEAHVDIPSLFTARVLSLLGRAHNFLSGSIIFSGIWERGSSVSGGGSEIEVRFKPKNNF